MTGDSGYGFPSDLRLRNRREFLRVKENGKKIHTPHFLIFSWSKPAGPTRIGITASRKIGGAVERNRVKRIVREFFRLNRSDIPDHLDISIIAKRGAHLLEFGRLVGELEVLLASPHRLNHDRQGRR